MPIVTRAMKNSRLSTKEFPDMSAKALLPALLAACTSPKDASNNFVAVINAHTQSNVASRFNRIEPIQAPP